MTAFPKVFAATRSRNGGFDSKRVYSPSLGKEVEAGWVWYGPNDKDNRHRVFGTFEDLEAALDIHGWKRDGRTGHWVPQDTPNEDRPCGREYWRDEGRWTSFHTCNARRKPGESACGTHLRADRQAIEREREYKEQKERDHAGEKIALDAQQALKGLDISSRLYYAPYQGAKRPGGYTGEVTVHAEDILRLTRELEQLREEVKGW